jgi:hypothetical protein
MTDPFRDWAQEYSEKVGELPDGYHPAAGRARLLFAYRKAQAKRFPREGYWTFGAAALVMAGALLWWAPWTPGENHAPAHATAPLLGTKVVSVGQEILAAENAQVLSFENGTRATFERQSSGKLSKLSADTVELTLEQGSLAMEVERKEGRSWIIKSGKFRVYVIGTAFSVRREADTGRFKVRVKRGQVRIQGPELKGAELLLEAGEEFDWQPSSKEDPRARTPSKDAPSDAPNQSARDASPEAKPHPEARPPQDKRAKSGSSADAESAATWQTLARAGKYELALESVEKLGPDRVIREAGADDRLLLGNAARYSGRMELGSRAYLAARDSGGAAAPLAAYYLAKIALDSNGDQSGAIRWLQTYLREAPSGDLAVSARARLMNLLQATGRHGEAKKVAAEYLALHPSGPNAQAAKQLLERR